MLAARIANAHAEAYIERGVEMHSQASRDAEKFLSRKLVELKEQLQKSEVALNDYRRAKGIIPGLMSLDGKDAVVIDRLTDLSKDLTRAQVDRISLESQVELIHKHLYDSLPVVMDDRLVQTMQGELNQLAAEDASLAGQFTERLSAARAVARQGKFAQVAAQPRNPELRQEASNRPTIRRWKRSTNSKPRCSASAR